MKKTEPKVPNVRKRQFIIVDSQKRKRTGTKENESYLKTVNFNLVHGIEFLTI